MAAPFPSSFGGQQPRFAPPLRSPQYQHSNGRRASYGMGSFAGSQAQGSQDRRYMGQQGMNMGYNEGQYFPQRGMSNRQHSLSTPQFSNPFSQNANVPFIDEAIGGQRAHAYGSYFPSNIPHRPSLDQTFGQGQFFTPPVSPYRESRQMSMMSPTLFIPEEDLFDESLMDEWQNVDTFNEQDEYPFAFGHPEVAPRHGSRRSTMVPISPRQLHSPIIPVSPFGSPTRRRGPPMTHRNSAPSILTSLESERAYSYPPAHLEPMPYPGLEQDMSLIGSVGQTLDIHSPNTPHLIKMLCQKAPEEIDAMRSYFMGRTGDQELSEAMKMMLDMSRVPGYVKYPFMGLILGPLFFDHWLLTNLPDNSDDILIDIFVGRHTDDLRMLNLTYNQGDLIANNSLMTQVQTLTESPELQRALKICAQSSRPDSLEPLNKALVDRDVVELSTLLASRKPEISALFDIILRRSDNHLIEVCAYYQFSQVTPLDTAILQCPNLVKMVKKIAVHAIRTASDVVYRDIMLLRHCLYAQPNGGGEGEQVKLGIRMVRMHWYKEHFRDVREGFARVAGRDLPSVMSTKHGIFRELMLSLATC